MAREMGYSHVLISRRGGGAISRVYGGSTHLIDAAKRNKHLDEILCSKESEINGEMKHHIKEINRDKIALQRELNINASSLCHIPHRRKSHSKKESDAIKTDYIPTTVEKADETRSPNIKIVFEQVEFPNMAVNDQLLTTARSNSFHDIPRDGISSTNAADSVKSKSHEKMSGPDIFKTDLESSATIRKRSVPTLERRLSKSHNDISDVLSVLKNPVSVAVDVDSGSCVLTNESNTENRKEKENSLNDLDDILFLHESESFPPTAGELHTTDSAGTCEDSYVRHRSGSYSKVRPTIKTETLKIPQRPHTAHHDSRNRNLSKSYDDYEEAVTNSDRLLATLGVSPPADSMFKNDFSRRVKVFLSQYDDQNNIMDTVE